MGKGGAVAGVLLGVVVALPACGSRNGGSAPGLCAVEKTFGATCASCVANLCASQLANFDANCASFINCMCTSGGTSCGSAVGTTCQPASTAIGTCVRTTCASSCTGTDMGVPMDLGPASTVGFLYAADWKGGGIVGYSYDSNGNLAPLRGGAPYGTAGNPGDIVAVGNVLVVSTGLQLVEGSGGVGASGGVQSFAADTTTGLLTAVSTLSSAGGRLAPHPSAPIVYAVNGGLVEIKVDSTGNLTAAGGMSFSTSSPAPNGYFFAVHPSGKFGYALVGPSGQPAPGQPSVAYCSGVMCLCPEIGRAEVVLVNLDASGTPTLGATLPLQNNWDGLALEASGNFLYTWNIGGVQPAPALNIYKVDAATGALTANGTLGIGNIVSVLGGAGAIYVAQSCDPRFTTKPSGNFFNFSVNASTGALTEGAAYSLAWVTRAALDPGGRFVFAAGSSGLVYSFAPDATLGLRQLGMSSAGALNYEGLAAIAKTP
jgi:hypothetical protein